MNEHIFTNIMIGLSLAASLTYALNKNWGLAAYWFFAASINITVVYFINAR